MTNKVTFRPGDRHIAIKLPILHLLHRPSVRWFPLPRQPELGLYREGKAEAEGLPHYSVERSTTRKKEYIEGQNTRMPCATMVQG